MAKPSAVPTIIHVEVSYVAYDTGDPRAKPDTREARAMAERLILAAARTALGEGVVVVRRAAASGMTVQSK